MIFELRLKRLAALTVVPLEVFVCFASLASHLPSDAGATMAEMNQDAREIQNAISQMATAIYMMIIMLCLIYIYGTETFAKVKAHY